MFDIYLTKSIIRPFPIIVKGRYYISRVISPVSYIRHRELT
jgi:hypothetical protein